MSEQEWYAQPGNGQCPETSGGNRCELEDLHTGKHFALIRDADLLPLATLRWEQDWQPANRAARRAR